jgi:hypothetical protein
MHKSVDTSARGEEDLINSSKIRDQRLWRRWRKAGALGRLHYLPCPSAIDTSCHFWDAFGNMEMEISARWIVRLCQNHGSWRAFTWEELSNLYATRGPNDGFWFNGLDEKFVVKGEDGRYRVSVAFVRACYYSTLKTA